MLNIWNLKLGCIIPIGYEPHGSKWYRREFLLQNELFFEENIYWEDVVHTLKSIYLSKIFMYIPLVGYVYVQTPNSDMRGVQNGQKIADVIRFCVDSFEFLQKQGASITIIEFQREYYERVLRKYKYNLHFLQKKDFDILIMWFQNLTFQ